MLPTKKHCHPHSASNQGHCEFSIAQFLKQITLSADFLPADTQKHPSSHGNPQKEGCWTHYPVVIPITAYSHQQSRYQPLFSTAPQALLNVELWLAVLSEVLNGTDHLRGVGVLVVVPRHDLNLIGVVVATLNFHDFLWSFIISKQQLQYHSIPLSYQNRLVRTKIIPRLGVIFKFFRDFVF